MAPRIQVAPKAKAATTSEPTKANNIKALPNKRNDSLRRRKKPTARCGPDSVAGAARSSAPKPNHCARQ
jgi:hypothetical protein